MSNSSPASSSATNQPAASAPSAPSPIYVADTVALVLRLEKRTMGAAVEQAFQEIEQQRAQLLLPAMVFAEIMYLSGRKRITATLADVETYVTAQPSCMAAPLTLEIVKAAQTINDIPELHDRLIAATAVHHKAILLTNDVTISASTHVQTLW